MSIYIIITFSVYKAINYVNMRFIILYKKHSTAKYVASQTYPIPIWVPEVATEIFPRVARIRDRSGSSLESLTGARKYARIASASGVITLLVHKTLAENIRHKFRIFSQIIKPRKSKTYDSAPKNSQH